MNENHHVVPRETLDGLVDGEGREITGEIWEGGPVYDDDEVTDDDSASDQSADES